ncbi:hypothetical protein [Amycolatopsis anabasis]|uniref:hypothetical protein n=1 Tax=Amycolatopsis anabasis TaxID=1840409 RepID=UPI00131CC546|nr:hypothetical protein [Amycolatopsis anabasis]
MTRILTGAAAVLASLLVGAGAAHAETQPEAEPSRNNIDIPLFDHSLRLVSFDESTVLFEDFLPALERATRLLQGGKAPQAST